MPTTPAPLPPELSGGPFTTRVARAAGVRPGRLRAADLRRPHRGVRVPVAADRGDLLARCRALAAVLPEGARFSHVTALGLLGVDAPWSLAGDDRLHIEVGTPGTRPRIEGVVAHRSTGPAPLIRVLGLPVLGPEAAWTRTADRLQHVELVVLADALCRRTAPITTPDGLAAAVDALRPGTRGIRRLRAALAACRPGTDSGMETRARLVLADAGMDFVVNRPVRDARGRFVALPDLSDPVRRVAVEYDGDVHRTDKRTWRRDIARRQAMESEGWRVVTITADDVLRDGSRWLTWVASACRSQTVQASRGQ